MISHYRDHAANERTYLAWVRTGITVMMLGFLVERFDIFLIAIASQQPGAPVPHIAHSGPLSLSLVALGTFMIFAATVRFLAIKRAIDGEEAQAFRGLWLMLLVSLVMVAFGLYLFLYLYGLP